MPDFNDLVTAAHRGDEKALSQLLPLVYGELRQLARRYVRREQHPGSMSGTALVHEAYLRLADGVNRPLTRGHFIGIASRVMRQVLVDRARARHAAKRGGHAERVTLDEERLLGAGGAPIDVLDLDRALTSLEAHGEDLVRVVELRVFGGLTVDETAAELGVSPATVKRKWTFAKAFLLKTLAARE